MILIVHGHISSRDAKYAITLWKKFESGLAKFYASGAANWACRKRRLRISVSSTGPTLEVLNGVSVTSHWSTLKSWPGLSRFLSPNCFEESEPQPRGWHAVSNGLQICPRQVLVLESFQSLIPTV